MRKEREQCKLSASTNEGRVPFIRTHRVPKDWAKNFSGNQIRELADLAIEHRDEEFEEIWLEEIDRKLQK